MSSDGNALSDNSISAPLKKRKVSGVAAIISRAEPLSSRSSGARMVSSESQELREQQHSAKMALAEQELQVALEKINYKDKLEFLEACRKFPDLVQKESDPQRFLRREDLNAQAAAERLVAYWKERSTIFGARAYRSMLSLSQTDALDEDDVATMSSGLIAKLPDDVQGRTVLCIDRTRSDQPDAMLNERWARCVFYWLSLAAENEVSQSQGIVLMRIVKNPNEDQARFKKILTLIKDVMPIKVASLHLCCLPPRGAMRAFTDTVIPASKQNFSDSLDKKAMVHLCKSEEEMIKDLERSGFTEEVLPASLGGAWTYTKFDAWVNQRIRVDIRSSAVISAKKSSVLADDSKSETLKNLVTAADVARVQDRRDRKRKMDAIYARKRRERERVEEHNLQNQCLKLNEKNLKLQSQNGLFEHYLGQAKAEVLRHEREAAAAQSASTLPSNGNMQQLYALVQQQQQQQSLLPALSRQPVMPPLLDIAAVQRVILQNQQEQERQQQQAAVQQALEREQVFRQNLLSMLNGGTISPQEAAQLLQARNSELQSDLVVAPVAAASPQIAPPNLNGLSQSTIVALLGTSAAPKQDQQAAMPEHMTLQRPSMFQTQNTNDDTSMNPGLVQALLRTQSNAQQQSEEKGVAQYFFDLLRKR